MLFWYRETNTLLRIFFFKIICYFLSLQQRDFEKLFPTKKNPSRRPPNPTPPTWFYPQISSSIFLLNLLLYLYLSLPFFQFISFKLLINSFFFASLSLSRPNRHHSPSPEKLDRRHSPPAAIILLCLLDHLFSISGD
jgi:hypothetical protein